MLILISVKVIGRVSLCRVLSSQAKTESNATHMQVDVPGLQARCWHSATAFSLCPGVMEVTLFGGCPECPSDAKTTADFPQIANTTVLQFGESISCMSVCPHTPCSTTVLCGCHRVLEGLYLIGQIL